MNSLLKTWWIGARPRTLPAAIVPVLVGASLALREGSFSLLPFVAALLASILIQIGTNLTNDVADYLKGADKNRAGPVRITQAGLATPRQVIAMTAITFGLAAILGVYLIYVAGWPILLVGVLSILAGIGYTAGPFPLAYNGLGDVFTFIFFGLVATVGAYFIHAKTITLPSVIAALPVALMVTNIIVINNMRDIPSDTLAHKRTLAVIIGDRATRLEYAVFAFSACFIAASLLWMGWQHRSAFPVWLVFLVSTVVLAQDRVHKVYAAHQPMQFNKALAATSLSHLIFGILFATSIAIS